MAGWTIYQLSLGHAGVPGPGERDCRRRQAQDEDGMVNQYRR